jgi:hypothetical protein
MSAPTVKRGRKVACRVIECHCVTWDYRREHVQA